MTQPPGPGWTPPPGPAQPSGPQPGQWGSPPPLEPSYPTKYCHACATAIDARAEICPRCGVRQPTPSTGPAKSRSVAAALALILGNFGVHKFYLGQVALGILYLVFFWTYIPGVIAWLEAIYFLTRSNEDWARRFGGPVQVPNAVGIGCLWVLALWPLVLFAAFVGLIWLGGEISSILSEIGTEI